MFAFDKHVNLSWQLVKVLRLKIGGQADLNKYSNKLVTEE
jgi:hypothetical protein